VQGVPASAEGDRAELAQAAQAPAEPESGARRVQSQARAGAARAVAQLQARAVAVRAVRAVAVRAARAARAA
jgi:hypothetical protein